MGSPYPQPWKTAALPTFHLSTNVSLKYSSTNERDSWQCHYGPPQKWSPANVNHYYSTDCSSLAVRSFRNFPCFPIAHTVSEEWHPPLNHRHWGEAPCYWFPSRSLWKTSTLWCYWMDFLSFGGESKNIQRKTTW